MVVMVEWVTVWSCEQDKNAQGKSSAKGSSTSLPHSRDLGPDVMPSGRNRDL